MPQARNQSQSKSLAACLFPRILPLLGPWTKPQRHVAGWAGRVKGDRRLAFKDQKDQKDRKDPGARAVLSVLLVLLVLECGLARWSSPQVKLQLRKGAIQAVFTVD